MTATYDGERITKKMLRSWAARIREDLRDADDALKRGNYAEAAEMYQDASAAAVHLETLVRVLNGEDTY